MKCRTMTKSQSSSPYSQTPVAYLTFSPLDPVYIVIITSLLCYLISSPVPTAKLHLVCNYKFMHAGYMCHPSKCDWIALMTVHNVLGSFSHLSYMLDGQFSISSSKRNFLSATTLVISAMGRTNFVQGYESESVVPGSKMAGEYCPRSN